MFDDSIAGHDSGTVPAQAPLPTQPAEAGTRGDARARSAVGTVLRQEGIHAALGHLNGRTRYRFTGIFRFDPPHLRNVHLYDRENPSLNVSGAVHALPDTYCSLVRATNAPFTTAHAPRDWRLARHAARETVISYLGVPIRLPGGVLLGVLCHYDVRPRLAPAGEVRVLESIAPLLASWLTDTGDVA